ncbi:GPI-linked NAD(P)(+)--arginine ADP-ribosyltransferase 1 [Centropristis striata]|uniref:GPI-linked NAD(P)(+)--arginine ADP-ribosyltransferase 1 n=1 Tax=Centropristis striata TaxID=184440 RepID=UPI0027DF5D09|nr:GPI-linked NAD(P)(+)--arginine ADP-ribosyltransferase 1 [Centropristis striata]
MCDRRKLLVAAIVFTALSYKVTSEKLDMAPDAVDDQFDGCRKEALKKFIHSGLLKQELNSSKGFQQAWKVNPKCSKVIPGGTENHTTALLAYASGEEFSKTFDDAVETQGANVSTYEDHFDFKALHFLLMDSMLLLKPKKKECKTVHLLKEETQYTVQNGSTVRFGRFTKAQLSYSELKRFHDFNEQVVFNITSCFFVNLGDICSEYQGTALLSPAEVFTVVEEKTVEDDVNESAYTVIVLNHLQVNSTHNCYSFSRSPAGVSMQWLALMLMSCASVSFFL